MWRGGHVSHGPAALVSTSLRARTGRPRTSAHAHVHPRNDGEWTQGSAPRSPGAALARASALLCPGGRRTTQERALRPRAPPQATAVPAAAPAAGTQGRAALRAASRTPAGPPTGHRAPWRCILRRPVVSGVHAGMCGDLGVGGATQPLRTSAKAFQCRSSTHSRSRSVTRKAPWCSASRARRVSSTLAGASGSGSGAGDGRTPLSALPWASWTLMPRRGRVGVSA